MADEQYRWLNGETAEHLLRGESVEAVGSVDASARDQAERLAGALGALSAPSAFGDGELPGEAAAVAAFRKAVEARSADAADRSAAGRDPSGDVGLVRLGRPARTADGRARSRLRRPVRLGVAAALLFGSLGGAAALAVTGVIPSPFDDSEPGPAATVSAAVTPDSSAGSASPDGTAAGGVGLPSSGGTTAGGTGRDGSSAGTGGPGATGQPGGGVSARQSVLAACRAVRDGKVLGAGRERALEAAAGGASRVWTYCRGVLQSAGESTSSSSTGQGGGNGNGNGSAGSNANGGGQGNGNADGGSDNGNGNGNGNADGGGQGNGNANGGGQGKGNGNADGGDDEGPGHKGHGVSRREGTAVTPSPAAFAPRGDPAARTPSGAEGTPAATLPSPEPTYSAL